MNLNTSWLIFVNGGHVIVVTVPFYFSNETQPIDATTMSLKTRLRITQSDVVRTYNRLIIYNI